MPSGSFAPWSVVVATPLCPLAVRTVDTLATFDIVDTFDPAGRVCLDVGASTGGFTDVLLARGARHVYAVDVGRDQLHARLGARPDVTSMESTDVRNLVASVFFEPPAFAVIDVSFISLRFVLPAVSRLLLGPATLVALIKPQFEAGRGQAKRGIVHDPAVHAAVCDEITKMTAQLGWAVTGLMPSPIAGGEEIVNSSLGRQGNESGAFAFLLPRLPLCCRACPVPQQQPSQRPPPSGTPRSPKR